MDSSTDELIKALSTLKSAMYELKKVMYEDNFIQSCIDGKINKVKKIYKEFPEINISLENDKAFESSCIHNRLKLSKFLWNKLYKKEEKKEEIIHRVLISVCTKGHLKVVQWLWEILKKEFKENNELKLNNTYKMALYQLCIIDKYKQQKQDTLQWLIKIKYNKNLKKKELENKTYIYILKYILKLKYYEEINTEEICNICYNNTSNCKLNVCIHKYCKECIEKIEQCGYCRTEIF